MELQVKIEKCQSDRCLAYYNHRENIVASGENEDDAKENLEKMYEAVIQFENSNTPGPFPS